jgi:hypothetical protein
MTLADIRGVIGLGECINDMALAGALHSSTAERI